MSGFCYRLRTPEGHYLGEYVLAQPDRSEGDTFTDTESRPFRIVTIDPARILGPSHATCTAEPGQVIAATTSRLAHVNHHLGSRGRVRLRP